MKDFAMKKKQLWLRVYLPLILLLTSAATALRTVSLLVDYNVEEDIFVNSTLITVAGALAVISAVFAISYVLNKETDSGLVPHFSGAHSYVTGAIVAISLLYFAISLFTSPKAPTVQSGPASGLGTILVALAPILALASTVYFVLNVTTTERTSMPRTLAALTVALFLALYSVTLFLTDSRLINAEARILDQMSLILAAVFFLFEARLSLGRDFWRGYAAFGMAAAAVCAYTSIPTLIVYFVRGEMLSSSLYGAVLIFSLFIYTITHVGAMVNLRKDRECALASAINSQYANENEATEQSEGETE